MEKRKDFADEMKLRILSWEDYTGFCRWIKYNHKSYKEETEFKVMQVNMTMEAEIAVKKQHCWILR